MTWDDFSPPSNGTFNYTSGSDVIWAIPLAVLLLAVRYSLDSWCFRPLAIYLGINSKTPKKIPPTPVLETAYRSNGVIKREKIVGLSKQLDWTERQVERWLRLRRASEKPTTLVKFTESCWRFFYYTGSSTFGAFCVWDKPWARDSTLLVSNFPHSITTECWWYCMLSCAFYWSLLFSQSVDVKRKDYLVMFVHHLASIGLVSLSWTFNAHRMMIMGFFMFDISDVFIECTKMAKYAKLPAIAAISFPLMTIVWMATRWVWYPWCIVRLALLDQMFGGIVQYFTVNSLLLTFLVLNIYWTYCILHTWFAAIIRGPFHKRTNDCRSSDDGDTSEESNNRKDK